MPKAPPAPKLRTRICTTEIREGSKRVPCGKLQMMREGAFICPNRENHILPFMTGFCHAGFHEGQRAKTFKGNPAKTCDKWLTCACECHDTVTLMFELANMERVVIENPEYNPPHQTYWMPRPEDYAPVAVPSTVPGTGTPPDVEGMPTVPPSVAAAVAPATVRTFEPTQSGRTAKGQLELWVKMVCDMWLMDDIDSKMKLTPQFISECCLNEIPDCDRAPSPGAVDAVLKRWEKIGFCVYEKKPSRFTGYTDDGKKYGLDSLKSRAKRATKSASASQARSFRRQA